MTDCGCNYDSYENHALLFNPTANTGSTKINKTEFEKQQPTCTNVACGRKQAFLV